MKKAQKKPLEIQEALKRNKVFNSQLRESKFNQSGIGY
jgi:hypothetical protein